jgi:hypothetical protein
MLAGSWKELAECYMQQLGAVTLDRVLACYMQQLLSVLHEETDCIRRM